MKRAVYNEVDVIAGPSLKRRKSQHQKELTGDLEESTTTSDSNPTGSNSSDDSNTNFTDYPTSTISSNTPEHSLGNTRNTSSSSNWEATPTSEEDEKEYDVHVDVVTMDTNSCRPSRGLSITDSGLGLSHSSDSDKCFLPSNPRNWTRVHVLQWVCAMSKELNVNLDAKQFYMNGMGLSLISQDGFIRRTGSSAKGTFMFKDIKSRYNNS